MRVDFLRRYKGGTNIYSCQLSRILDNSPMSRDKKQIYYMLIAMLIAMFISMLFATLIGYVTTGNCES